MSALDPIVAGVLVDVLDASDVGYWSTAIWKRQPGREAERLHVVEIESHDDRPRRRVALTADRLATWLRDTSNVDALVGQVGDPYQHAAVQDLARAVRQNSADLARDVDFDAETGDLIVQMIALGSVVYG